MITTIIQTSFWISQTYLNIQSIFVLDFIKQLSFYLIIYMYVHIPYLGPLQLCAYSYMHRSGPCCTGMNLWCNIRMRQFTRMGMDMLSKVEMWPWWVASSVRFLVTQILCASEDRRHTKNRISSIKYSIRQHKSIMDECFWYWFSLINILSHGFIGINALNWSIFV